MKRYALLFLVCLHLTTGALAQEEASSPVVTVDPSADMTQTVNAAAAVASGHAAPRPPDFLEAVVDGALEIFDVKSSGNTVTRYVIAVLLLVIAFLLRRVVTIVIFGFFRKLAARTKPRWTTKCFLRWRTRWRL